MPPPPPVPKRLVYNIATMEYSNTTLLVIHERHVFSTAVTATVRHIRAPPLQEVQRYSAANAATQSKRAIGWDGHKYGDTHAEHCVMEAISLPPGLLQPPLQCTLCLMPPAQSSPSLCTSLWGHRYLLFVLQKTRRNKNFRVM